MVHTGARLRASCGGGAFVLWGGTRECEQQQQRAARARGCVLLCFERVLAGPWAEIISRQLVPRRNPWRAQIGGGGGVGKKKFPTSSLMSPTCPHGTDRMDPSTHPPTPNNGKLCTYESQRASSHGTAGLASYLIYTM